MNHLFEFSINHWPLVTAFIMLLILVIISEVKAGGANLAQLSTQSLVQRINRDEALLFDLRPKADFRAGHIANASSTSIDKLQNQAKYQKKKVILVCQTGEQSLKAQQALLKAGFESVEILKGGINSWLSEGLPLIQAKAANS